MDYSTAICDAQGLTLPMHLGSIPTALAACIRHYDNEMKPGDIYVLNDPFDGGMHLPDIFLFQPIPRQDREVQRRRSEITDELARSPEYAVGLVQGDST